MRYVYLDESGNTAPFQASRSFLAVAVVSVGHKASRALETHMKRLKKRAKVRAGGELKAVSATRTQRARLLRDIAREDIAIIAVVVDKRAVRQKPDDPEDWYREAMSLAALHCALRWSDLRLLLDKRYTKQALRDRLDQAVRERLGDLACNVLSITQRDSTTVLGLQVADYVAWAIRRKHAQGEEAYYDLVKDRIIIEEVIEVQ